MYEYIEGELVAKTPTAAVIDASGVGYRVHIPLSTFRQLPDGGRVKLLVYLQVREDLLKLFGFATEGEREAFLLLLGVPRVGPSLALAVLSGLSLSQLSRAIAERQPEVLARVKGVGKATAERIVQELYDDFPAALGVAREGEALTDKERDVVAALLTLGYQRSAAEHAARRAVARAGPEAPIERLVTEALKGV